MMLTVLALTARTKPVPVARRLLAGGTAMGLVFLAIKSLEWRGEIAAGLVPSTNTFLALYFTLTGLHALHVAGGLVANLWALAGRAGEVMTAGRVRALALYWTFVEIVWLIIFGLMYLW
jgi:heme/copper-type cytochrome/quinol oxidase subunit 3